MLLTSMNLPRGLATIGRDSFLPPFKRAFGSGNANKTGAGIGNVQSQMLPSTYTDSTRKDEDGQPLTPVWNLLKAPRTATIIPAPMTFGQPFTGVDLGPSSMIEEGLPSQLSQLGWRIENTPEVDFATEGREAPGARNSEIVGGGAFKIAELVRTNAGEGKFPLTLGGDHSISIGTLAGMLSNYPDLGVIWVDAHADLNTPEISGSGNMHGMPVGLCTEGMMKDEVREAQGGA